MDPLKAAVLSVFAFAIAWMACYFAVAGWWPFYFVFAGPFWILAFSLFVWVYHAKRVKFLSYPREFSVLAGFLLLWVFVLGRSWPVDMGPLVASLMASR